MQMSFQTDLETGQDFESTLIEHFSRIYKHVTHSKDKGEFSKYDFAVRPYPGKWLKFESKLDAHAVRTGNILIETHKRNKSGVQPSGLSTSQADRYIFGFTGHDTVYSASTQDIWNLIWGKRYFMSDWVGDRGNAFCYFFKWDELMKICRPLFKLPSPLQA